MTDRERLTTLGFAGFVTVGDLRVSRLAEVPSAPGVYVFLRLADSPPSFLAKSVGGQFKAKDPTAAIETLQRQWVTGSAIIYIGKAGGLRKPPTLRKRLQQYLDFGAGNPVGHWGGRFIWQLKDAEELVVCWRPVADEHPGMVEERMLAEFARKHGRLPFANLKRGDGRQALY